jgi:peptidyl-prolyl cis-trans isomerase C
VRKRGKPRFFIGGTWLFLQEVLFRLYIFYLVIPVSMSIRIIKIMSMCRLSFIAGVLLGIYFSVSAQNLHNSVDGAAVLARNSAGVVITVNDLLADIQRAPDSTRLAILTNAANLRQAASNLLIRRVLAKEAERDGLDKEPLVVSTLHIASDRVLSDARLAQLDAQNTPSRAALEAYAKDYYKTNTEKFERPAQTRASHILLPNKDGESLKRARDLLEQIRVGASFEELAKTNSIDSGSALRGGDLGFFSVGQMVRPFDDAVNKLMKPGDISEPVESQFGYHIIRLEERREKGVQPFEQVREQLLTESRIAILNNSRGQKALEMNKDFIFEMPALEAMAKSEFR